LVKEVAAPSIDFPLTKFITISLNDALGHVYKNCTKVHAKHGIVDNDVDAFVQALNDIKAIVHLSEEYQREDQKIRQDRFETNVITSLNDQQRNQR
jgi:hypothetical protein